MSSRSPPRTTARARQPRTAQIRSATPASAPARRDGSARDARPPRWRPARPAPRSPRRLSARSFPADLGQRQLELEPRVEPAAALDRLVQPRQADDGVRQLGLAEPPCLLAQLLRRERLHPQLLGDLGLVG